MHSRGIKNRTITHPILQDNYSLILIPKQRCWRCTNPECLYDISESFKFVNKQRKTTIAADILIVDAYRNLLETSASIAKRFHVSDSHAHEVFDRYALVIQDFHAGNPIDLLRSRKTNVTEPYFVSISTEECNQVKYLISDMYNPYIAYVEKYFPNAFHVIQWITRSINSYIRQLIKKDRQRDREYQDKLSFEQQRPADYLGSQPHIISSRNVKQLNVGIQRMTYILYTIFSITSIPL